MTARSLPILRTPRTRAECLDGPRPCPHVRCRHHLFVSHITVKGAVRSKFTSLDEMTETCSLDVAERGPNNLETVGDFLGLTRERVRQIEADALAKLSHVLPRDMIENWTSAEEIVPVGGPDGVSRGFARDVRAAYERVVPARDRGAGFRGRPPPSGVRLKP